MRWPDIAFGGFSRDLMKNFDSASCISWWIPRFTFSQTQKRSLSLQIGKDRKFLSLKTKQLFYRVWDICFGIIWECIGRRFGQDNSIFCPEWQSSQCSFQFLTCCVPMKSEELVQLEREKELAYNWLMTCCTFCRYLRGWWVLLLGQSRELKWQNQQSKQI